MPNGYSWYRGHSIRRFQWWVKWKTRRTSWSVTPRIAWRHSSKRNRGWTDNRSAGDVWSHDRVACRAAVLPDLGVLQMIRFLCPTCKSVLESPEDRGGKKVTCPNPKCKQRLEVPAPPMPSARTKTALGSLVG